MPTTLRRWMYLDHDGIVQLHGQLFGDRVLEQSKTIANSRTRAIRGSAELGAFGARVDLANERTVDERVELHYKTARADVQMLLELEGELARSDALTRLGAVRDIAELNSSGAAGYVTGVLRFKWHGTHNINAFEDAVQKQMVEFEIHRDANDDAGMLSVPVVMGGSLAKCVDRKPLDEGSLSPSSHLGHFLRRLDQGVLPLGFFAHLNLWGKLIYLKPYAIWFP